MAKLGVGLIAACLVLAAVPAEAQAPQTTAGAAAQELPKDKQTKLGKYLSAKEASEMLAGAPGKTLFVDVRTRGEVQFVGVPAGLDAHVPYVDINEFGEWDDKANRYKLDLNSNFGRDVQAALVRKGLDKAATVILICRSGDRSARAVNLLADLGYSNAYSVFEGFEGDMSKDGRRTVNGWKNAGLPWTYALTKAQAYQPGK